MQTPAITLWFPVHNFLETFLLGFFILEKRLASQILFLVRSKHPFTFRVVCRYGIFGWYLVGIFWYLPNWYQRKTRSGHFGIIFLAGTPFFLKRGVMAPFLRGLAPMLRKKGFPAKPEQLNCYGHIWPTGFLGLRSRLITFRIFACWLCLIAQNVAELFSSNSHVFHL